MINLQDFRLGLSAIQVPCKVRYQCSCDAFNFKKKTFCNKQGFSDLPLLEIHIHQCWMLKREKGENEKGLKSYAEVTTSLLESLKLTYTLTK